MAVGFSLSLAAPFGWWCPSNLAIAPFPHRSHRTERAQLAYWFFIAPLRAGSGIAMDDPRARQRIAINQPQELLPDDVVLFHDRRDNHFRQMRRVQWTTAADSCR